MRRAILLLMPLSLAASLRLPLRFVENAGQAHPAVRFHAAPDVLLTATGVVLASGGATLRIEFDGANPSPLIQGLDPLAGQSNYLVGGDPARWRTGLPNYARVRYEGVYPGIDVVFYGNRDGRLEYDLVVRPPVDAARLDRIRLRVEGAERICVGQDGDLVIETPGGSVLRHGEPIARQSGAAATLRASYAPDRDGTVAICVDGYDRERELVIDPPILASSFLGGSGEDVGTAIAVGNGGEVFVTGTTRSIDFPTAGAWQPSCASCGVYEEDVTGRRRVVLQILGML